MQSEIIIDHGDGHGGHEPKNRPDRDDSQTIELHAPPKPVKPAQNTHDEHVPKHPSELPPMQIVIQLNVYRDAGAHYEYLLLKRIDEDDKFWQIITEPVPTSSTLIDTMRQAAEEQAGLRSFKHLSHEMHSYEWYAGGQRGRDIVFAAEVDPKATVAIDKSRYEDFAWLPYDQALLHLKWNGNKQALRQLNEHLRQKRLNMPATVTTGFYGNGSTRHVAPLGEAPATHGTAPQDSAAASVVTTPKHGPYSDRVPKRLPDVPEDGVEELKPYPEEDDERIGEWFL